ncbi:MAG: MerR family DNA-binding transcriptional regulator [Planctomycetota bacterium]
MIPTAPESDFDRDASGKTADDAVGGQRIAIAGRLGGMNRREASNLLRSHGATVVESDSAEVDWIVIGAEESPLAEAELITDAVRSRVNAADVQIVHETELWHRLGLVDVEQSIRKLHTPAMLAHLLGVSVRVIRRWHRRGLIQPVRTLHRLPYFDFQEIATAKRLAQWVASGASSEAIERRLMELIDVVPHLRRPLDQLSILIEGTHVLLRQGEGLIEPGGQLRFDFDAATMRNGSAFSADASGFNEDNAVESVDQQTDAELEQEPNTTQNAILRFQSHRDDDVTFPPLVADKETDDLLMSAYQAEDDGDWEAAIECYHTVLAHIAERRRASGMPTDGSAAGEPSTAHIHFQIAELLYRMGETIAARERYFVAIEVDPDHVEARSSLAGVLAETGQLELAVAAYRGALSLHDDYSDVHYNLAKILDELNARDEARSHWERFLELVPNSPWADEARDRLDLIDA